MGRDWVRSFIFVSCAVAGRDSVRSLILANRVVEGRDSVRLFIFAICLVAGLAWVRSFIFVICVVGRIRFLFWYRFLGFVWQLALFELRWAAVLSWRCGADGQIGLVAEAVIIWSWYNIGACKRGIRFGG
jgi:hypothetical protein